MKIIGYVVLESCEDYEQVLGLDIHDDYPPGGILAWPEKGAPKRTVFPSRKDARAAIERTEHMRIAFGWKHDVPERRFCHIEPVVLAAPDLEPA